MYWKKKVKKFSNELKVPQMMKTAMQTIEKLWFFQRELGIMAGRPAFSCRSIHRMKAGMSANPTIKSAMMRGEWMSEVLPVKAARTYDRVAREVEAMMAPIQSMSWRRRCRVSEDSMISVLGRPNKATTKMNVFRMAAM